MKISNRSLHYRFNAFIQQDKFTDRAGCNRFTTCSYIRTTIYSAMIALWFGFIGCICASVISFLIGSAIWVPISIFFMGGTPGTELTAGACIVWGLIAFGLAVLTFKYIEPRFITPAIREPNIFVQAIKDQHNKFCTRVEVVA